VTVSVMSFYSLKVCMSCRHLCYLFWRVIRLDDDAEVYIDKCVTNADACSSDVGV